MIIGSHNTMTYAKPRKWWMHLIAPFAVCQRKNIEEQLNYGIELFDLRVRLHKDKWIFAHGLYEMQGDIDEILDVIVFKAKEFNTEMCIRLILEASKADAKQEEKFVELCERIKSKERLKFMGGNRKFDWKQIYDFGYNPNLWQPVSSMAEDAHWYERYVPLLYAQRMNNVNLSKCMKYSFTLLDFV